MQRQQCLGTVVQRAATAVSSAASDWVHVEERRPRRHEPGIDKLAYESRILVRSFVVFVCMVVICRDSLVACRIVDAGWSECICICSVTACSSLFAWFLAVD